jgi:hypothetical protein
VDPDPGDVVARARNIAILLHSLKQFYKVPFWQQFFKGFLYMEDHALPTFELGSFFAAGWRANN